MRGEPSLHAIIEDITRLLVAQSQPALSVSMASV
jgi:hypothetical protein